MFDDEKAFLDTLIKRLEKREIKADAVYDGQSAITFLSENTNTDVVVLDVKMPGMGGLETLQAIKNDNPLVEVIMLTGHATVQNAIEGMKRGAFDYLMKPVISKSSSPRLKRRQTRNLNTKRRSWRPGQRKSQAAWFRCLDESLPACGAAAKIFNPHILQYAPVEIFLAPCIRANIHPNTPLDYEL